MPIWDKERTIIKPTKIQGMATKRMGCYHMKYYLNGESGSELIAIGVVDILPRGLESAYFFYSPDLRDTGFHLSLGVFSAVI